jgi:hypothetical protein
MRDLFLMNNPLPAVAARKNTFAHLLVATRKIVNVTILLHQRNLARNHRQHMHNSGTASTIKVKIVILRTTSKPY